MAVSAQQIGPGVYFKIFDLSEYVRTTPTTIGFLPIVSERGPDNRLILTNARDFYLDFGEPNISFGGKLGGQGMYVAHSFLRQSDSLYVVRVMPDNATFSNLALSAGIDGPVDGTKEVVASSISGLNSQADIETIFQEQSLEDVLDRTPEYGVVFHGVGRGDWYDNFRISIRPHLNVVRRAEGVWNLDLYQKQNEQDWDPDTETFSDAYSIILSLPVSFDPNKLDSDGDSLFIEDVLNRNSRHIKCVANRAACKALNDAGYDWSMPFDAPVPLDNGSNGRLLGMHEEDNVETDVPEITDLLTKAYTGILPKSWGNVKYDDNGDFLSAVLEAYVEEVHDTENYYFNIVLDGGYDKVVKRSIISLVKDLRQDCVAILDNGDNPTPSDALTARQDDNNFNTFYAALYEPYSKIFDPFTGQYIWITPVFHMAKVIAFTDRVAEIWFAPAGFNRGTIEDIFELRYTPSPGWRDQFYLNQINPIVKFNVGNTVWGQLTTQKRPTALQDLNVVRLVLYIKRALEEFCKFYIFEQNDQSTWNAIASNINKFLKVIQNKRGLYDYSVEVGATEYEIKAKNIHVNVTLNPTKVVERIFLNFYIV